MTRILVIGQAPPLKMQAVPYDTTLLYTMLEWVGVSKDQAQDLFEFEAMTDQFPGKTKSGGHRIPTKAQCYDYYSMVLREKLMAATKVILLGATAKKFFIQPGIADIYSHIQWLELPHPSRRNYNRIMKCKREITEELRAFI